MIYNSRNGHDVDIAARYHRYRKCKRARDLYRIKEWYIRNS